MTIKMLEPEPEVRDCIFVHHGGKIQDVDELPGWYFWDETDAYYHGPFATREEASKALITYCEEL